MAAQSRGSVNALVQPLNELVRRDRDAVRFFGWNLEGQFSVWGLGESSPQIKRCSGTR